jgi:hypothetical protein
MDTLSIKGLFVKNVAPYVLHNVSTEFMIEQ